MDITFQTEVGKFNYRVCAVILHAGRLLAMQNERTPYYFLPGGRVQMNETAEAAISREIREELGIEGKVLRPLWLNQSFFQEDVTGERFHELCLYFLVDVSGTALLDWGSSFVLREERHINRFQWLALEDLQEEYLYPMFIKKEIFNLPEHLTLRAEFE